MQYAITINLNLANYCDTIDGACKLRDGCVKVAKSLLRKNHGSLQELHTCLVALTSVHRQGTKRTF